MRAAVQQNARGYTRNGSGHTLTNLHDKDLDESSSLETFQIAVRLTQCSKETIAQFTATPVEVFFYRMMFAAHRDLRYQGRFECKLLKLTAGLIFLSDTINCQLPGTGNVQ